MKEGEKIVENYELLQQKTQIRDGLKIIPARHLLQHRMYSLKKLKLDDENKNKYSALVNQINILKQIRDVRMIMCYKILRTTSSIYVSYDYMSENTLQSYMQAHRSTLNFKQKLKIALKLANFFSFLKINNIVNLNIKPSNIQVLHKNDKKQIQLRFNNFQYTIQINKPISQVIVTNVPVSRFVPLEIFSQEININHYCSIYILGKLFEFIQLNKQNTNTNRIDQKYKESIALIKNTTQKMVAEKQSKRPTIQQIIDLLNDIEDEHTVDYAMKTQQDLNDLLINSRSNKKLNMAKTTSFEELSSRSKSNKKYIEKHNQEECKKKFNQYCLMIIKARNLSLFLLKCCEICLKVDFIDIDIIVEVSYLFLKKSTSIMNQLYKFMSNGRHKDIAIPSKQFGYFSKSTDFFRLQNIISKDLNFSKKYLSQMLMSIHQNYNNLLQNPSFKKETSNEDVQNSYIKVKTIYLLKIIIQNSRLKSISKEALKYFHILSYLINFDSFEDMFKQLINQQILELERQTLFINAGQMHHQFLLLKLPQFNKYLTERVVEL